jgi:hypothetical protein
MTIENISLPRPTNATRKGPLLNADPASLSVRYDHERENGTLEWTRILFREVLAFEYRQSACCEVDDVIAAHAITSFDDTEWLFKIVALWRERVGWQQWHQQQGGGKRFRQFRLYFDDAGCLDVISSSYAIESLPHEESDR